MSGSPRRRTVPGNRWDLVLDEVDRAQPRSVAVIVPYYEQPDSLARMYAALADLDPSTCSIVIADDGSNDGTDRLGASYLPSCSRVTLSAPLSTGLARCGEAAAPVSLTTCVCLPSPLRAPPPVFLCGRSTGHT